MAEDPRIIHVVPGLDDASSGIASAARLISATQNARLVDARRIDASSLDWAEEVWVHSTWTPAVWHASSLAVGLGKRLVRMPHGNLDPFRRRLGAWKKMIAGPLERRSLRIASRIVVTCDAERLWVKDYLGSRCPPIDVMDMRSLFPALSNVRVAYRRFPQVLRVLYMGRRHPLKGVECLETAVRELNEKYAADHDSAGQFALRIVSDAHGADKEAAFDWCDVLCLPTLSDNFGIVVAEALVRGKPVITTDGAPAWADEVRFEENGDPRLVYLDGYRAAFPSVRVAMLRFALESFVK